MGDVFMFALILFSVFAFFALTPALSLGESERLYRASRFSAIPRLNPVVGVQCQLYLHGESSFARFFQHRTFAGYGPRFPADAERQARTIFRDGEGFIHRVPL